MSRGTFKALDYIKSMIESILPKTDNHSGFVCIENATGLVTNLNDRFESQRQFILDIVNLSMDDGSAGLSGRKRVSIEIKIRYAIPKDPSFRLRMMNEDSGYIIDKIKGPEYNFNETGIVSIIPNQARADDVIDQAGNTIAHLLTIPFDLLYLES